MKNVLKLIVPKPMKCNKNAVTFLSPLLFTTGQRGKNIEKTLFVSAGAQRGEK